MSEERNAAARIYREAAEAYFGAYRDGPTVEAAGKFWRSVSEGRLEGGDDDPAQFYLAGDFFRRLYGVFNPWVRLHGFFILAVTRDKVHALAYGGFEKIEVTAVIAVFDRDEVWLRSDAGGKVIYLESRKHQVALDGSVLEENTGAAEMLAALTRPPANEAAGLSV
jgi:hypothetical protein